MKTPKECLAAQIKNHSLSEPKHIEELDKRNLRQSNSSA